MNARSLLRQLCGVRRCGGAVRCSDDECCDAGVGDELVVLECRHADRRACAGQLAAHSARPDAAAAADHDQNYDDGRDGCAAAPELRVSRHTTR